MSSVRDPVDQNIDFCLICILLSYYNIFYHIFLQNAANYFWGFSKSVNGFIMLI